MPFDCGTAEFVCRALTDPHQRFTWAEFRLRHGTVPENGQEGGTTATVGRRIRTAVEEQGVSGK
ncbi:hypothetical protein ACWC9X_25430 [Streptomyces asoensis]|uniref:hypothetical protein n=1 Tax=Streptomyces asoensis TaxID=249586 RepID=UPI0036BED0BE